MTRSARQLYEFGPFRLDAAKAVLWRGRQVVPLTPRLLEMLLVFVENSEQVIEKDELMSRLWPDSIVEESNLTVNISALRKALGQRGNENRYIVTVPGRGYRFIAEVKEVTEQETEVLLEKHSHTEIVIEEEDDEGRAVASLRSPPKPAFLTALRHPQLSRKRLAASLIAVALFGGVAGLWFSGKLQTAAPGAAVKTMAVLPFKLLGDNDADEYLGIGMADALITRLSGIKQINVRPTSAVLKYARLEKEPVTVGQELKVDSVLEGSIRRSGERVRVTVQLVSVDGGRPVWADKFDEQASDVFTVEDRISARVADALKLRLTAEESRRLYRRYTENPEAYQAYLKGRYCLSSGTTENAYKAIEYFNQAIQADPLDALAYAGLADSYTYLSGIRSAALPPREALPKAKAAAQKALAIDEELAEAHLSLALVILRFDWNWFGAEQEFKRAIELNPTYAPAHFWYAEFFRAMQRPEEMAREVKLAYEIDPLSPGINLARSLPFHLAGEYEQEIEWVNKVVETNPNYPHSYFSIGASYTLLGRYEEAIAAFEKAASLMGRTADMLSGIGYVYAVAGRKAAAQEVLEELQAMAKRQYVPPGAMALVYLGLGEHDKALEWLEKAVDVRASGMIYLRSDRRFDALGVYPRFTALLRRIGLVG
ncbi:MAG: hypothetical protein V7641_38 [Blastocatellia bacterium]